MRGTNTQPFGRLDSVSGLIEILRSLDYLLRVVLDSRENAELYRIYVYMR